MPGTYAAIYLHLVWGTWDRMPLLTPDIERDVYRVIGAECANAGAAIVALGGIEDHVHLLAKLSPALAPAELVKQIKGVSSRVVNTQLLSGGSFRWRGGYGAVSVSPSHLERVTAYIARQKEHHATGKLSETLERIEDHPLLTSP